MTTHHGSHPSPYSLSLSDFHPTHSHLPLHLSHKQIPTAAVRSFLYLFPASSCWRFQSFSLHGEQQHGRVFGVSGAPGTNYNDDHARLGHFVYLFFCVCLALDIFCINVFCLLFVCICFVQNGGSKEEGRGNAYVFLCTTRDRDTMTRSMSADLAAPCLYCFLRHAISGIQAFSAFNWVRIWYCDCRYSQG